jgi:hypothetical protein
MRLGCQRSTLGVGQLETWYSRGIYPRARAKRLAKTKSQALVAVATDSGSMSRQSSMAIQHAAPPCRTGTSLGAVLIRSTLAVKVEALVGAFDCNVAMDSLNTFGLSRNGHGLVCRFLSSGAAGQPYDAIPVGFDMNALQAGYMLCSQLGLDLGCYGRILQKDQRT